jgi:hypothetical protein
MLGQAGVVGLGAQDLGGDATTLRVIGEARRLVAPVLGQLGTVPQRALELAESSDTEIPRQARDDELVPIARQ